MLRAEAFITAIMFFQWSQWTPAIFFCLQAAAFHGIACCLASSCGRRSHLYCRTCVDIAKKSSNLSTTISKLYCAWAWWL